MIATENAFEPHFLKAKLHRITAKRSAREMTGAAVSTSLTQGAEGVNPAKRGDGPHPRVTCARAWASQLCRHIPAKAVGFLQ